MEVKKYLTERESIIENMKLYYDSSNATFSQKNDLEFILYSVDHHDYDRISNEIIGKFRLFMHMKRGS
jgi:hypothetical protein